MPPKEPTKHQLSARLQFQSHTPAFLRAFQNQISGRCDDEDEDDEDEDDEEPTPIDASRLNSDELMAEVERFLRDQGD